MTLFAAFLPAPGSPFLCFRLPLKSSERSSYVRSAVTCHSSLIASYQRTSPTKII